MKVGSDMAVLYGKRECGIRVSNSGAGHAIMLAAPLYDTAVIFQQCPKNRNGYCLSGSGARDSSAVETGLVTVGAGCTASVFSLFR